MRVQKLFIIRLSILFIILSLFTSSKVYATWSIIAVDRKTEEIGIAGASCTFDVQGIASVLPGKGAIVVQAASNYFARMRGVDLMDKGASNAEILAAMKAEKFEPSRQQYGVISLKDRSVLVDTGIEVSGYKGHKITANAAVLGNLLPGDVVLEKSMQALNTSPQLPLAERLMNALAAGEKAGGDKRCGLQYARSAFLSIYQPTTGAISKLSVYGIKREGQQAVSLLKKQFDAWKQTTAEPDKTTFLSLYGRRIATAELDTFIENQMQSLSIPGLSIAFIDDGRVAFHRSLGKKNVSTGEAVDDLTLFDAASMTKTVFSVLALKMVDQGLIDLDTPLYTYWPYPDIQHDDRYKRITARMVLSHTSGFPNLRYLNDKGEYNPDAKLRLMFEPGAAFLYSGEGYLYLAKVIAHMKGIELNDFQTLFKNEIFDQLNMKHSAVVWSNYVRTHRAHGHLKGSLHKGWSINASNPNFHPAHSLQSNAFDFALFLDALITNKLLSKESHEALLSIQTVSPATPSQKERSYGLGIVIEPSAKRTFYLHGGNNLSATSKYRFDLDNRRGYVFFLNSEHQQSFDEHLVQFLSGD